MTPAENTLLQGLIDTLLPGGHGFPAASATGMAGLLAARLHAADPALLGCIAEGLGALPAGPDGWHDAVARLEADEPKLFDEARKYAYLTYYEQHSVIMAIRPSRSRPPRTRPATRGDAGSRPGRCSPSM